MYNKIKINFLLITALLFLLLSFNYTVKAQSKKDTANWIAEFKELFSFGVSNNIKYTLHTSFNANPVLDKADTLQVFTTYMRKENLVYYKNNFEEMYLNDSLLVTIDHEQKQIKIEQLKQGDFEKLSIVNVNTKLFTNLLKDRFTISKKQIGSDSVKYELVSKDSVIQNKDNFSKIEVYNLLGQKVPLNLTFSSSQKMPLQAQDIAQLKQMDNKIEKQYVVFEGETFLQRNQQMKWFFTSFSNNVQAIDVPAYSSKISLQSFTKIVQIIDSDIKDFEIIKNF